ncbi:MAG: hypothetical protein N2B05_12995 [Gemmatimonadales bacterium]
MHNAMKYGVLLAVLAMFAIPSAGMTQPATGKVSVDLRGGVAIPAGNMATYTEVGGTAGASALWNWNPNWGFRVDFDWIKLNKGEDDFGVLLSPPQTLMFLGGSFEVNFNGQKLATDPFTFMANVGAGAMKMTVDDTYDTGHSANTFDHTYPAFQGGAKVGYQVAPWINIFVNGTAYFILMDAADTSAAFGNDFNNGWVIPVTAGVRLSFLVW